MGGVGARRRGERVSEFLKKRGFEVKVIHYENQGTAMIFGKAKRRRGRGGGGRKVPLKETKKYLKINYF